MPSLEFLPQFSLTSLFTAATFATVLVALIKVWPIIALQVQGAREKLRAEGRSDLSDCRHRIDTLQRELNEVKTNVHNLEMKLVGAISAYRILDAEVESRLPGSTALAQARLVMSTAFTMSPSTAEAFFDSVHKSDTLKAAEDTCHAAEVTVEQVKRDEKEGKA